MPLPRVISPLPLSTAHGLARLDILVASRVVKSILYFLSGPAFATIIFHRRRINCMLAFEAFVMAGFPITTHSFVMANYPVATHELELVLLVILFIRYVGLLGPRAPDDAGFDGIRGLGESLVTSGAMLWSIVRLEERHERGFERLDGLGWHLVQRISQSMDKSRSIAASKSALEVCVARGWVACSGYGTPRR